MSHHTAGPATRRSSPTGIMGAADFPSIKGARMGRQVPAERDARSPRPAAPQRTEGTSPLRQWRRRMGRVPGGSPRGKGSDQ